MLFDTISWIIGGFDSWIWIETSAGASISEAFLKCMFCTTIQVFRLRWNARTRLPKSVSPEKHYSVWTLKNGTKLCGDRWNCCVGKGLFGPDFLSKLALNPETRAMLAQPDFLQIIQSLGNNPSLLSNYMGDPRLQKALMVSFQSSDVCVCWVFVYT